KPKIPAVTWSDNLVWKMIGAADTNENRNIAIGRDKDSVSENTTSEAKTQVFKRIAKEVIPHIYAIDPESAGKRTSAKWDSLKKTYREHLGRLNQTGNGVENPSESDGAPSNLGDSHQRLPDCFIPPDGPNGTTTARALNLWAEITQQFPFFPKLHSL
ncbi:hypothetical protein BJ165DRAFT_1331795, partial [Panaeolus papilionaceus]